MIDRRPRRSVLTDLDAVMLTCDYLRARAVPDPDRRTRPAPRIAESFSPKR